ncbi:MAG: hypothetical protein ACPIOQ_30845, partial [Promethearchaeia archaeon]
MSPREVAFDAVGMTLLAGHPQGGPWGVHLRWRNWAHAAGLEKKHSALNKREATKRTREQA